MKSITIVSGRAREFLRTFNQFDLHRCWEFDQLVESGDIQTVQVVEPVDIPMERFNQGLFKVNRQIEKEKRERAEKRKKKK